MIDIDECSNNDGGCHSDANCINSIGSYECQCKPGYIGNGIECSPCNENEYSFNDTICLSCPENTISLSASSSILDCKCNSFNHYLDIENSICLPCEYGFKVDEMSNVCKSNLHFILYIFFHSFISLIDFILFLYFILFNKTKKKNPKPRNKMSHIDIKWKYLLFN